MQQIEYYVKNNINWKVKDTRALNCLLYISQSFSFLLIKSFYFRKLRQKALDVASDLWCIIIEHAFDWWCHRAVHATKRRFARVRDTLTSTEQIFRYTKTRPEIWRCQTPSCVKEPDLDMFLAECKCSTAEVRRF